jgi:hypothetical protein
VLSVGRPEFFGFVFHCGSFALSICAVVVPGQTNLSVPNLKKCKWICKGPKIKKGKKLKRTLQKQFKGSHSKNLIGHIGFFWDPFFTPSHKPIPQTL